MSRPSVTYINQLAYADVPYPTTLNPGDVLREPYPSVARAGCGLCCVCMMVEFGREAFCGSVYKSFYPGRSQLLRHRYEPAWKSRSKAV